MKEETDRFIYFTSLFSNVIRCKMKKKKEENPSSNEKAFLEMETVDRAEKNCLKCHKI